MSSTETRHSKTREEVKVLDQNVLVIAKMLLLTVFGLKVSVSEEAS